MEQRQAGRCPLGCRALWADPNTPGFVSAAPEGRQRAIPRAPPRPMFARRSVGIEGCPATTLDTSPRRRTLRFPAANSFAPGTPDARRMPPLEHRARHMPGTGSHAGLPLRGCRCREFIRAWYARRPPNAAPGTQAMSHAGHGQPRRAAPTGLSVPRIHSRPVRPTPDARRMPPLEHRARACRARAATQGCPYGFVGAANSFAPGTPEARRMPAPGTQAARMPGARAATQGCPCGVVGAAKRVAEQRKTRAR
jgi:hypothetical protein